MRTYVLGLCFDGRGLWLIRKAHPDWQAGKLNGIGGQIVYGETPVAAMVREFEEETGVMIAAGHWHQFCRLHGPGFVVYCYRCDLCPKIVKPSTQGDEDVGLYHVESIWLHETVSNLPWLIEMAKPEHSRDWPYDVQEKRQWEETP